MKKILLILLLSLTLFAKTEDTCMLDVYFGNGVGNTQEQAEKSLVKLRNFLQTPYRSNRFPVEEEGETYAFKIAYNETYGVMEDVVETYWLLKEGGQMSDGYFKMVSEVIAGIITSIPGRFEQVYREKMNELLDHYYGNGRDMLQKYRMESFNPRHNILLVAHSQGNLFGNEIYKLLSTREKSMFRMVSVATPANNVLGVTSSAAPYTTKHGDTVIAAVPNHLPSNVSGRGHGFHSYLYSFYPASKISNDIGDAVAILDERGCDGSSEPSLNLVAYKCDDANLMVDIYASRLDDDGITNTSFLAATDKRESQKILSGACGLPLGGKTDFIRSTKTSRDGECFSHIFATIETPASDKPRDIDKYHSALKKVYEKTYYNYWDCTSYKMSREAYEKLYSLWRYNI